MNLKTEYWGGESNLKTEIPKKTHVKLLYITYINCCICVNCV